MTLAVVTKGPEGIVLAADSRVTLTTTLPDKQKLTSYFDNAKKLLRIKGQDYVGVVTYGAGAIGATTPRTAHGYISEFEKQLAAKHEGRATVLEIAQELGSFYTDRWSDAGMPPPGQGVDPMSFIVGGFDEGEPYGRMYEIFVPTAPAPKELNAGVFGMTCGGQTEYVSRLLTGVDPRAVALAKEELGLDDAQVQRLSEKWRLGLNVSIPVPFLPLQDCVDLSTFLVKMTAEVQTWTLGIRGVGGAVDVATVTSQIGFEAIQEKRIRVRS
jgi:hypothetical protein